MIIVSAYFKKYVTLSNGPRSITSTVPVTKRFALLSKAFAFLILLTASTLRLCGRSTLSG